MAHPEIRQVHVAICRVSLCCDGHDSLYLASPSRQCSRRIRRHRRRPNEDPLRRYYACRRNSISCTTTARSAKNGCRKRWARAWPFIDYNNDGWQDILIVNGTDLPGHGGSGAPRRTLPQQPRRHVSLTSRARPDLPCRCTGMGVAVGDYDNDGYDDLFVTALGQSHLFPQQRQWHIY